MISISKAAARQIKSSAIATRVEEPVLRIAAVKQSDGAIEYRMGFDDIGASDVLLSAEGVDLVIAEQDKVLLQGITLDYVEVEEGEHRFIFLNPNDPHYVAPND